MPIEQEPVNEAPYDALAVARRALLLELLEFCSPLVAHSIVQADQFLFVKMIMAAMVRRNFACFFDLLEKCNQAIP